MEEAAAIKRAGRTPGIECGLQQGKGAEHVGLQEGLGVGDRPVDMRLRGQMRDPREFILLKQPPHQRGIPDVALDEHDAAVGNQGLQASNVGGVGQGIDDDQPVGRARGAPGVHQVLPDEARTPGNQNALHPSLSGQLTEVAGLIKCLDLQWLLLI
jgi:hypothetical protein